MEPERSSLKQLVLKYKLPLIIFVVLLLIVGVIVAKNNTSHPSENVATSTQSTKASSQVIEITEMGIKVTLPTNLTGMKYSIVKIPSNQALPPMATLSLGKYTRTVNACFGTSVNDGYTFATIVKQNSKAPAGSTDILKQFDTFYIKKLGPSVPKSKKCNDASSQAAFDKLTNELDSALQTAFSSAQQL